MKPGIQSFLYDVGTDGCYALCILQLANASPDRLEEAINKRFIKFNYNDYNDNDNMYVMAPAEMLTWLTGKKWTLTKEAANYQVKPSELVVERWERVKTGATIGHFRLPTWDPISDSVTVRLGTLVSKRVFRCEG